MLADAGLVIEEMVSRRVKNCGQTAELKAVWPEMTSGLFSIGAPAPIALCFREPHLNY